MYKDKNFLKLPDGRMLCYSEYGNPNGKPALLIHGTPLCRLMWKTIPGIVDNQEMRFIAPDRPGYGYSDVNPQGALPNFSADMAALLTRLGIAQCAIAGVSGGGPYILECALEIPDRLTKVILVSSVGPAIREAIGDMNSNRYLYQLAKVCPQIVSLQNHLLTKSIQKDPVKFLSLIKRKMQDGDRAILDDQDFIEKLADAYREGCRQKSTVRFNIMTYDIMQSAHWSIPLAEIEKEVHVLWGGHDRSVGDQCRYMAEKIPNTVPHYYPEEGHFLIYRRMQDVIVLMGNKEIDSN